MLGMPENAANVCGGASAGGHVSRTTAGSRAAGTAGLNSGMWARYLDDGERSSLATPQRACRPAAGDLSWRVCRNPLAGRSLAQRFPLNKALGRSWCMALAAVPPPTMTGRRG